MFVAKISTSYSCKISVEQLLLLGTTSYDPRIASSSSSFVVVFGSACACTAWRLQGRARMLVVSCRTKFAPGRIADWRAHQVVQSFLCLLSKLHSRCSHSTAQRTASRPWRARSGVSSMANDVIAIDSFVSLWNERIS